jgi:hypothetical protein
LKKLKLARKFEPFITGIAPSAPTPSVEIFPPIAIGNEPCPKDGCEQIVQTQSTITSDDETRINTLPIGQI